MKWPKIEVWRMSASRPWHLELSHPTLIEHLKYSGELEYHLIESILVEDLSKDCIEWGKKNGYKVTVINPAQGQGYTIWYYLNGLAKCKYGLKWEDDFHAVVDIPLDNCVALMEKYPHINQICFNKRETMRSKRCSRQDGEIYEWMKEQREFDLGDKVVPLVCKEKWWFGSSIWRIDFVKPIFQWWPSNTHNLFNDRVIIPKIRKENNRKWDYDAKDMETSIGCYIYGKVKDPKMVCHYGGSEGLNDSLWYGDLQKRWKEEGKEIIGI